MVVNFLALIILILSSFSTKTTYNKRLFDDLIKINTISFRISSLRKKLIHPSGESQIVGLVPQTSRIIKAVWETASTFFDQESLNLGITLVLFIIPSKFHKSTLFPYHLYILPSFICNMHLFFLIHLISTPIYGAGNSKYSIFSMGHS